MSKAKTYIPQLLVLVSVVFLIVLVSNQGNTRSTKFTDPSNPSMKGLCWVAGDSITNHNFNDVVDVGANWISQTPFGFMRGHQSTEVRTNYDNAWWGETDRGIKHTTALAKAKGIKTMLKPHIWMRSDQGKWRSDITMNSEEEWNQWFKSYGEMMLHYAELAEECKIESLCIGTELYQTTRTQPDKWRALIKQIREVYSGELTYAANWYKEFEEITFWDDLDYIGVQAYFPLSEGDKPNKKELLKSWERHNYSLSQIAEKYGKKIVFTEIGYKNTADSAKEPWTWPQQMSSEVEISEEMQIACYNALFEAVWNQPWFDGMFIWKWFHSTYRHNNMQDYYAERLERRKAWAKRNGRTYRESVHFTPQYGHAKNVLADWYNGSN